MKNGTCPKCSSTEIMTNVKVRDVGSGGPYPLRVEVEEPEQRHYEYIVVIVRLLHERFLNFCVF